MSGLLRCFLLSGSQVSLPMDYGEVAYAVNPAVPPAAAYSLSLSASLLIVIPYGVHLVGVALLFERACLLLHACLAGAFNALHGQVGRIDVSQEQA